MLKLSIEDDEGKTTVVPLSRDEMTIGRLDGNTIRLTERNVSRRHARLSRQNGSLYIEDLASFTGVRVNGTKIVSPTPLREGDEVQIGDYHITLRGDHPPITDRPTMPTMPVVNGPMATVGGAVAIPGRASVAAMAAQPAAAAQTQAAQAAPAATARPRTKTAPPAPIEVPAVEAAPAVEPVDGQPTIPLRALSEQGLDPGAGVGPAARLVVLTTDLAGFEVTLDKASLVIGRTDENDVVLNHRSISRHHAKIVRDGDRYTIVDLQSANGVRVNGEDYERIELNPGDVLELGHVKLRFVGPLEQFVFDGRVPVTGRRMPAVALAAGGGALVVVAVAALFLHRGGRPASEAAPPPVTAAPAPPPPPPPAPPAVAPIEPPAPPAPPAPVTPAALLASARTSMSAEDWESAETSLGKINGSADPATRREAAALMRKVEIERQGAALYAKFDQAANSKDYATAIAGYAQIPPESLYRKRAQPRYEEARTLLVAEHMTAAEKARAEGRCMDVRQEASQVLRLDPKNMLVRDLARLCRARPEPPVAATTTAARPGRTRQVAAVTPTERAEAPRRGDTSAKPEPAEPAGKAESESEDAETLMKQAREAWLRQQCGAAMDLSRRALKAKPGWTDAYQILAVCSCSLKDAEAAEHAYARLDDRNRSLVHAVCQKNGITVGQ